MIAVQGYPELYDLSSPHYFDSNQGFFGGGNPLLKFPCNGERS